MIFKLLTVVFALLLVTEAARGRGGRSRGGNGKCRPMAGGIVMDCGKNSDSFKIQKIVLKPKKPVPGKMLDVHLIGVLRETISHGSTTTITAKYGFITVLDTKKDICKLARERKTGYYCPVKPQKFDLHHKVKIPSFAPSGKYKVDVVGYSQNKRRIFKVIVNANI